MKKIFRIFIAGLAVMCFTACTSEQSSTEVEQRASETEDIVSVEKEETKTNQPEEKTDMKDNKFYITIGEKTFAASFSDNSGADALKDWLEEEVITIEMEDYGGFEKVGSLGQNLPTSNAQTTTRSGDIVLYQGNQIVMFYGSNSWSYTRLGKVEDLTGWEEALGAGNVTAKLSLENPQE